MFHQNNIEYDFDLSTPSAFSYQSLVLNFWLWWINWRFELHKFVWPQSLSLFFFLCFFGSKFIHKFICKRSSCCYFVCFVSFFFSVVVCFCFCWANQQCRNYSCEFFFLFTDAYSILIDRVTKFMDNMKWTSHD